MIFLFQGCILRFHVNLPGCTVYHIYKAIYPRHPKIRQIPGGRVFGTPKNLLRRCLGIQIPPQKMFGCLGMNTIFTYIHLSQYQVIYGLVPPVKPNINPHLKIDAWETETFRSSWGFLVYIFKGKLAVIFKEGNICRHDRWAPRARLQV